MRFQTASEVYHVLINSTLTMNMQSSGSQVSLHHRTQDSKQLTVVI